MPVGFANKTGTRRVRFTAGVSHDGKDYGPKPDFKEDEADIDPASALAYTQQGRAVYVDVPGAPADGSIIPDEETVIGTGSSIRAVVGGGAINVNPETGENVSGLDTKNTGAVVSEKTAKATGKAKARE